MNALLSVGKDAEGMEVDLVRHQNQKHELITRLQGASQHGLILAAAFTIAIPRIHYIINTCLSYPLEGAENLIYSLNKLSLVFASEAISGLLMEGRSIFWAKAVLKLLLIAYIQLVPAVSAEKFLLYIPFCCLTMAFLSMLLAFIEIKY